MDELNENMKNQNFNEKNVVITFDDIDRSVYENAYPILKENKIPFTSFIVTDHVGDTIDEREYASWDEIEKMNESGLQTVGVHTHKMHFKKNGEHIFLNENNIDEFEKDLELSQNEFEKQLGYKPIYFPYPYGYGNPKKDEVLLNHGIEMIFSLNEGIVTKETKNFYMPRILITKDNEKYVANWFLKN